LGSRILGSAQMRFDVITLLPELVESVLSVGVAGRAAKRGLVALHCWNPRESTEDVHRTVDDRPYGGGPGMLMKADCLLKTIRKAKKAAAVGTKLIYLSPQGKPLTQKMLRELSQQQGVILLCGRYEGIDERVVELEVDEEWSLGDYVLSGGELGAMVIIDGVTRLQPSVLGHQDSAEQDSFTDNLLDCAHYTRPEVIQGLSVPDVLKSGDHKAIARYRRKQSLGRTYLRRSDLLQKKPLSDEDQLLLDEFLREYKELS